MFKEIVALDLETTGLDPTSDAIIEVGLVRFTPRRVEEELSILVNPGMPLSSFITQLTGITDEMLADAPRFRDVRAQVEDFVGKSPVLGHNVEFDLRFLRKHGLFEYNEALDTFAIASVVLPNAGRYNLAALASALGVPIGNAHRALDDAQMTRQIYLRMMEKVSALPQALLVEINRLGEEVVWGGSRIFEDVLEETGTEIPLERNYTPRLAIKIDLPDPLVPIDPVPLLDVESIASCLEPGGEFSRYFDQYESRSQQVGMLRAVADAFAAQRHLLVEAGTGTGKSMAYLLPAFAWAENSGHRVVISTNTINLQEQLIYKDIPDVNKALGTNYHAAVLKGRSNYLCPLRLTAALRLGPRSSDDMEVMAKTLVWLASGGSGDRSEINLIGPAQSTAWSNLSAEYENCWPDRCPFFAQDACPYYMARRKAESAHVVVINHALLMADIATGSRVIPEYQHLIVDEAHHIESAATDGLSFVISEKEMVRSFRGLGTPTSGLLGQVRSNLRLILPPEQYQPVKKNLKLTADHIAAAVSLNTTLFESIDSFLADERENQPLSLYGQQQRITPGARTLERWSEIEIAWDNLRGKIQEILTGLKQLYELVQASAEEDTAFLDIEVGIRSGSQEIQNILEKLDQFFFEPDQETIYWVSLLNKPDRLRLHAAPLQVGSLIEQHLWHSKDTVIMTSATLTTGGEFDYIKKRLNAQDADELVFGSPFDYETSTLLYLLQDIPEPNEQHYQHMFTNSLTRLCKSVGGRTLVLFTSHNQLRSTARTISDPLQKEGIQVFSQNEGASRHALLESFKETERAVLLGTRSFWEGVDVPGEALSVVAIARLPFDVPRDPIIAARSETFESPFDQYMLPEAILRFRQGFGRLIRTQSDRGVVVSFDKRLLSKNYGRLFVDSLPQCTVRIGPMSNLADTCTSWLNI
ncbi:MAG: DEAD/DEAH box helicase family protein [Anaerolineales bacterium]|nr:DEAD/DEAH box helicase family protein [Anaerolineales bacterium]